MDTKKLLCLMAVLVVSHSATQHIPNPPSLDGIECKEKFVVVHWNSTGDLAFISHFTLEVSSTLNPDVWEHNSYKIPSTESSWNLYLEPGINYTFSVIAHNEIGASKPSESSEVCSIQPDVPNLNPFDVKAHGTRPGNMVISWSIVPQIYHHGPGFFYKVSYKRYMSHEPWTEHVVTDWKQSELVVSNMPTFERYLVKVASGNSKGLSRVKPDAVIGWSGEDTPLMAPTKLTLNIIDGKSALARWDWVPLSSLRGHFLGYKLQVWTNDTKIREVEVPADKTQTYINVLEPYKMNYVRVMAYNGYASGPPSETVSVLPPEGIPGPVASIEAYPLGNTAIWIKWTHPEDGFGRIKGYIVNYEKVIGSQVGPMIKLKTNFYPTFNEAKLSHLEPGTKYRIWIYAVTGAGKSTGVFVEQSTTSEEPSEPDKPYFQVSMLSNKSADILVLWTPMLDGNAGTHFQVSYRPKGHSQWAQSPMELDDNYVVILNLKPQVYEVKVTSFNGNYSKDSDVKEVALAFDTYIFRESNPFLYARLDTGNWLKRGSDILWNTFLQLLMIQSSQNNGKSTAIDEGRV